MDDVDIKEFIACFTRDDVIDAAACAEFTEWERLSGGASSARSWDNMFDSTRDLYRRVTVVTLAAALKKITSVMASMERHPCRRPLEPDPVWAEVVAEQHVVADDELTDEERALRDYVRKTLAPHGITSITFVDDDGSSDTYPLVHEDER